ncbi:MAG: 6-phosphofructokinase [Lachnospiraceae bacterium]|nr:6-phosphofructokinase [Lachnospiraceae bacterium]
MKMKNAIVAQSGGPTVVINSALAGVLTRAAESGKIGTVYGAVNGVQGLLDRRIINLSEILNDEEKLRTLKNTPSMFLGSCRYKLSESSLASDYKKVIEILEEYDIGYFFYIGGNDSMDTVKKLSHYVREIGSDIKVMGIPKTIDNDLPVTDHAPGYGSAARYIATSVLEMAHDTYIYDTESILIVEIMGRDAGWLTASSALARNSYSAAPHLIYLPETSFDDNRFLADIRKALTKRKHLVIAVSEGIRYEDGKYVSANSDVRDQFGHPVLSGVGKYLETLVKHGIGCKVRSVEINVLQRCAAHLASATDIEESFTLGAKAVSAALEGENGKMAIIKRTADDPYKILYDLADIDGIANLAKPVPIEFIGKENNDVTDEFITYALPLIQGDPEVRYENSLPVYLSVAHLDN